MRVFKESSQPEPLSKIKGVGFEQVEMDYGDGHNALFLDGLLCGFSWFRKARVTNEWEKFFARYGRSISRGSWADLTPSSSRAAQLFVDCYGAQAERLLKIAIEVAKKDD